MAAVTVHDVAQYAVLEDRLGAGMRLQKFEQLVVLEDTRASIYMQPDLIAGEIHEHQRDVRTLEDIAEARQHAIAPIFGVDQRLRVERLHESGVAGAKTRMAFTCGAGGREKYHLHPGDERTHRVVQMIDHLMLVNPERVPGFPEPTLEP